MINKKHIYQYLLLPLLACLMAGTAGCSSEVAIQDDQVTGRNTNLTINARVLSSASDVDNYIKELRVIAVKDNGEFFFNEKYERGANGWTVPAATTIEEGNDQIVIKKEPFSGGSGKYTFYLIANETGYNRTGDSKSLSELLAALDSKSAISSFFNGESRKTALGYIAPGTNQPILMTAEYEFMVIEGKDNNIGVIELIRTVAKVDLNIQNTSGQVLTFVDAKLIGEEATSFGLMEAINFEPTTGYSGEGKELTINGSTVATFYLSERVLANELESANALQIAFTAKSATNANQ